MLRHTLLEWQDPDVAVAALAACLGVLPTGPPWDVLNANKGLICSNNPTSNALTSTRNECFCHTVRVSAGLPRSLTPPS